MNTIRRLLPLLLLPLMAITGAHAQAPAAPPKIAVTSLVGDTMNVTVRRDTTGTNLRRNHLTTLNMPSQVFDVTVMKAVQEALGRSHPGASVAMLRVPAAGSGADPILLFGADGNLAPKNGLVEALRQQGYQYLVAAIKLRANNRVSLASDMIVGTGELEGVGFYIDQGLAVQRSGTAERVEGIIAPHVYIQLALIDLTVPEIRSVQRVTANGIVSSGSNKEGMDAWGALSSEEKVTAIEQLIRRHVGAAVPQLFGSK